MRREGEREGNERREKKKRIIIIIKKGERGSS
jgi:hypothetical protein